LPEGVSTREHQRGLPLEPTRRYEQRPSHARFRNWVRVGSRRGGGVTPAIPFLAGSRARSRALLREPPTLRRDLPRDRAPARMPPGASARLCPLDRLPRGAALSRLRASRPPQRVPRESRHPFRAPSAPPRVSDGFG